MTNNEESTTNSNETSNGTNIDPPSIAIAIQMLKEMRGNLEKQNTRGEPANVRNQALLDMKKMIQYMQQMNSKPNEWTIDYSRFNAMEKNIKEIESVLNESSRTWAQVARDNRKYYEPTRHS